MNFSSANNPSYRNMRNMNHLVQKLFIFKIFIFVMRNLPCVLACKENHGPPCNFVKIGVASFQPPCVFSYLFYAACWYWATGGGWVRHQGGDEPGGWEGSESVVASGLWLAAAAPFYPTLISLSLSPSGARLRFCMACGWAHEFPWPPHAHPRAADGEACRRGGHTLLPPGARLSVRLALRFPWHIRGLPALWIRGLRLFFFDFFLMCFKIKQLVGLSHFLV